MSAASAASPLRRARSCSAASACGELGCARASAWSVRTASAPRPARSSAAASKSDASAGSGSSASARRASASASSAWPSWSAHRARSRWSGAYAASAWAARSNAARAGAVASRAQRAAEPREHVGAGAVFARRGLEGARRRREIPALLRLGAHRVRRVRGVRHEAAAQRAPVDHAHDAALEAAGRAERHGDDQRRARERCATPSEADDPRDHVRPILVTSARRRRRRGARRPGGGAPC